MAQVGRGGVWELGTIRFVVVSRSDVFAELGDTLSAGSRAGYRELFELQGRGKGGRNRESGGLERGFCRTRDGLSRGGVFVWVFWVGRYLRFRTFDVYAVDLSAKATCLGNDLGYGNACCCRTQDIETHV